MIEIPKQEKPKRLFQAFSGILVRRKCFDNLRTNNQWVAQRPMFNSCTRFF
jgi:hypothetical protein